jgi:hypothetical protein
MKANDKEYFRIHAWLIYNHGKAVKCENNLCKSNKPKRYEWALLKGNDYKKDRKNFIQLCPSCHRKYDFTENQRKNLSDSKKGKEAKNKIKVILNKELIFNSITDASIKTGLCISSIHNNLKGLSKTTKIGIWEIYEQTN